MIIKWFVYRTVEILYIFLIPFLLFSFDKNAIKDVSFIIFLSLLLGISLVLIRNVIFSCIKGKKEFVFLREVSSELEWIEKIGIAVKFLSLILIYNITKIYDLVVWEGIEEKFKEAKEIDFKLIFLQVSVGISVVFTPLYIAFTNFVDFFSKERLVISIEKDLKLKINTN